MWTSHTARKVPLIPIAPNSRNSGTKADWLGMTNSPTMRMKKKFRPGNSMNVNAYAANAAMRIGMIVAGMLTARELRNAPPMGLEPVVNASW